MAEQKFLQDQSQKISQRYINKINNEQKIELQNEKHTLRDQLREIAQSFTSNEKEEAQQCANDRFSIDVVKVGEAFDNYNDDTTSKPLYHFLCDAFGIAYNNIEDDTFTS